MFVIQVTLKAYLARLRAAERAARPPATRRAALTAPTLQTLAADCHLDRTTISMLANNKRVNLDHLACIAAALHRRGYPVALADLLELTPVSS